MHARFHKAVVQRGGGLIRPQRVSKLMVVELSEKNTADCSRRVLAIGGAIFYSRSIFDRVFEDQMSNFRKSAIFFNFALVYFKTINRSDITLSPACSLFNYVPTYVSLQFLDEIFVAHSVPEGNSVTPSAKSTEGKLGQWP